MKKAWLVARQRNVSVLCQVLILASAFVVAGIVSVGWAKAAPARRRRGRVFASDAGMIINTIKADKTADFEMVVGRSRRRSRRARTRIGRRRPAAGGCSGCRARAEQQRLVVSGSIPR